MEQLAGCMRACGISLITIISGDPLDRLRLISKNENMLKVVACTFSGYHAINVQFSSLFASGGPLHGCKVLPDSTPHLFFAAFAETLLAEANELQLSARRIDS